MKYEILNRTGSSFCFEMFAGVERFCDFVLKKGGILGFELKNECWKDELLEGAKNNKY